MKCLFNFQYDTIIYLIYGTYNFFIYIYVNPFFCPIYKLAIHFKSIFLLVLRIILPPHPIGGGHHLKNFSAIDMRHIL